MTVYHIIPKHEHFHTEDFNCDCIPQIETIDQDTIAVIHSPIKEQETIQSNQMTFTIFLN